MPELIHIGTAAWTIPRQFAEHFPRDGSGLERYAARFTAVEINPTFHRSHQAHIFARWADAVPDGFRFAVKMPKTISHELRLLCTGQRACGYAGCLAAILRQPREQRSVSPAFG
jgi:uncharacterized protein YecE (DUF72 family)